MTYVARFSNNIEADIKRGWSGYFAPAWKTIEDALYDLDESLLENEDIDLEDAADDLDLMYDEHAKIWRPFHHYGLSCWKLEADTLDSARSEALSRKDLQWGGFGQQTIGDVKVVAQISDDMWLLECEDSQNES